MQITRVELKNIKNHAEASFTFLPGVVAICGPNGAGKTTILEAIAWALFDHLEYKRDDFVKRGAKRGQVIVEFISAKDARLYSVTRDTAGAYSVYDPDTKTRLVEQKNQVVKFLREHIGVDESTDLGTLFKTTIGVPQGTFTYDFLLRPGDRKKIFDQILKVEEYREASDKLRDTLRHIEARIIEADRQLAEAEGELKYYDATKAEHAELATQVQTGETDYATAQMQRDKAAAESARLDELKQQLDAEHAASELAAVKLSVKRGELATLNEALTQARQAATIVATAQAGYERYQSAAAQLAELEQQRVIRDEWRAKLAQTERALIEAQSQTRRLQEQETELNEAAQTLTTLTEPLATQTRLEAKLHALREQRGELQSLERARAALDQDLEQMRVRYTTLSKDIADADGLRVEAERLPQLESARAALDAQLAQHELARQQTAQQRAYLSKAQQTATRLQQALQQCATQQQRLAPAVQQAATLSELETQAQQQTEALAQLRAELARDEEMLHSLATGGICPLLTEKCLNLKSGESLETRFRTGLTARRAAIQQHETSAPQLAQQVQAARTASTQAAQLPQLAAEHARLTRELAEQQTQIAAAENELARLVLPDDEALTHQQAERATLAQQIEAARAAERKFHQAEGMRGELAELAAQGKTKRANAEQLAQRLSELSKTEMEFNETEAALFALHDPRSRAAALQQLVARRPALESALAKNAAQLAAIAAEQAQHNEQLQAYHALDTQLADVNVQRAASERDYHAYLSHQKIAERVTIHEAELVTVTAATARAETTLTEAQQAMQALAARYDADAHARAQHTLQAARERATQLATQLTHTRTQFAQLATRLAQLETVQQRRQELLGQKMRAEQLRTTADFIRDILQKAAPYITESYLYAISAEANVLYREITGRHDVTLRWGTDYEITLEETGRERPFANLSGGEQMAAALAVRLALLKELSEINLAFFDEPTTNMDEERRRNLAQQIGRIKDFQQLFVISHDDTFEGHTDQVILLGERSESQAT